MPNIKTRKEVGEMIGKDQGYVGVYVSRGKIYETERGKIDIELPTNEAFISKYLIKEELVIENTDIEETKPDPKKEPQQQANNNTKKSADKKQDNGNITAGNIDYVKSQYDLKLKMQKLKDQELALMKRKAKVLPIDLVIDIFNQYITGLSTEIETKVQAIQKEIIDKLDGDHEFELKYKKQLKESINESKKINHSKQSELIIKKANDFANVTKW